MEKAKLYCEAIPKKFGMYRVSTRDAEGREITGVTTEISDNYLDVNILQVRDERALVLFPKGLNRETAEVNAMSLN